MVDPDRTARKLHAKREALLAQLRAVDRAIAALPGAGAAGVKAAEHQTDTPGSVAATRVKPKRVLSEDHRQALLEGGRKARHSREAAAGRARELADPTPGLAPASKTTGPPRLVKREQTREKSRR
jgi:hypothetical protein